MNNNENLINIASASTKRKRLVIHISYSYRCLILYVRSYQYAKVLIKALRLQTRCGGNVTPHRMLYREAWHGYRKLNRSASG